jgi:hypothetical protein
LPANSAVSFRVLADQFIEIDPAFLHQQHDAGSDEPLTDGGDPLNRFRRREDLKRPTGDAVTRDLYDSAIPDDGKRKTPDTLPLHFGLDEIVCLRV